MTSKKTKATDQTPEEVAAAEAAAGREAAIEELRGRLGDQVTLYPIDGVWISGVPHEEHTVDVETAFDRLGYFPPAFTTTKPAEALGDQEQPGQAPGEQSESTPAPDAGTTPQEV